MDGAAKMAAKRFLRGRLVHAGVALDQFRQLLLDALVVLFFL
jgi:hypothetical protein